MKAIYKREIRYFFHSFVGWLYLAVMLFMMGIYFTVCNMLAGYPTISYVLQTIVFLIVFAIPILTMRALSEERKYKTDQLILTAPVSVGKIVLGKYLALVTVFAIPLVILGLTPLALMCAGEFQVGLSYTSLLGFFLYGCLGLAIGLFLSSLTESVVIAAVLTLIAMFVGYIMSGLCGVIGNAGTTAFSDMAVKALSCFDMVKRFDVLSSGYFEVEAVAYYVTFTAFVLFCTAQSIQKRRYVVAGRGIRLGAYSIFNILVAAALVVAVNVGLNYVPDRYTSYDVTVNDLFTLSEDSIELLTGSLSKDVTVYVLADESSKDEDLDRILQQMKGYSDHVKVTYIDPVANPMFYYKYTETPPTANSLIVVGESADVVVDYEDIYVYEMNYYTYQSELVANDAEGQIISAIMRATSDDIPKFYGILGHNELTLDETFRNALIKENAVYEEIQLQTTDEVPEDAYGIILDAPLSDYSSEDVQKVLAYLKKGGNALIVVPEWSQTQMLNFESILSFYGVNLVDGVIVEGDRNRYYQTPYDLFPNVEYDEITARIYDGAVLSPLSRGLVYDEEAEDVSYTPLLSTSDDSFSRVDPLSGSTAFGKAKGDIDGPFTVALKAEKLTESGEASTAVIVTSETMFTSEADNIVPGYNVKLFCGVIAALADREISVAIPAKYYEIGNLAFSAGTVYVAAAVSIFVLPLGCLIAGLIIWLRRRKK